MMSARRDSSASPILLKTYVKRKGFGIMLDLLEFRLRKTLRKTL